MKNLLNSKEKLFQTKKFLKIQWKNYFKLKNSLKFNGKIISNHTNNLKLI